MNFKREIEVATSLQTQPLWFRVLKWVVFLGVGVLIYGNRYFWIWVLGVPVAGIVVHLVYRKKTKEWTVAWGGFKPHLE